MNQCKSNTILAGFNWYLIHIEFCREITAVSVAKYNSNQVMLWACDVILMKCSGKEFYAKKFGKMF